MKEQTRKTLRDISMFLFHPTGCFRLMKEQRDLTRRIYARQYFNVDWAQRTALRDYRRSHPDLPKGLFLQMDFLKDFTEGMLLIECVVEPLLPYFLK